MRFFKKVLSKSNMEDCEPHTKPCDEGLDKSEDQSSLFDDYLLYRKIIGSLIYAMCCTRSD